MLHPGRHGLRQRAGPQVEEPDQGEDQPAALRSSKRGVAVAPHARGVVPRDVHEDAHERLPAQLDGDVGRDEHGPRVRPVAALARLEQRAPGGQPRDDLLPY